MRTMYHRAGAALRRLLMEEAPTPTDGVDDLARRVEHLEAALEGLQDAVYRQDVVHDSQIADLRKRSATRPAARSPGLGGERR